MQEHGKEDGLLDDKLSLELVKLNAVANWKISNKSGVIFNTKSSTGGQPDRRKDTDEPE